MSGLMDMWIDGVVEWAEEDFRVGVNGSAVQRLNGPAINS